MTSRQQGLRYLLVGLWNTVFGYGLFALLLATLGDRVHYLVLLVAATVIAILNAFAFYRAFVFRASGQVLLDLARFSAVYLVALVVNIAALALLVEMAGLPILIAQASVVAATAAASFFAHRSFSFRRVSHKHATAADRERAAPGAPLR